MRRDAPAGRVPAPLFWQTGVLAALAGVWTCRDPLAGLTAAALILAALGRPPRARLLVLGLCMAAGAGWAMLWKPEPPVQPPPWLQPGRSVRVEGVVAAVSGQPDRRLRVLLDQARPAREGAPTGPTAPTGDAAPLPGLLNWTWDQGGAPDAVRPLPGQTVRLTAKIRPVSGFANEGVHDSAAYWAGRNVWYTAWTAGDKGTPRMTDETHGSAVAFHRPDALRERWRAAMVEALGGSRPVFRAGRTFAANLPAAASEVSGMSQARAMLPALLFGDRYHLDSSTLDRFTRAGLVHSLALSGQHLALAGVAAALLVWLLAHGPSRLFLHWPRRTLTLLLGAPLAALYLWLGNAPPSLVRAAVMLFGGTLLWLGRRPFTLMDLLFFAALCLVIAWPHALFDLSVQLSMLSVTGIALALPGLRRAQGLPSSTPIRRIGRGAALLLLTSLAVQIATLPVTLSAFGRLTPLFPLNLLWLPVLELVVLPLAALGLGLLLLCGPQPVTDLLFTLASLPARALWDGLALLDARHLLTVWQGLKPAPLSILGYGAALAACACLAGRRTSPAARRLLACAVLLLPAGALLREADAWQAERESRTVLRVLDVGQGQAVVAEWPGGRLLLDGGGSLSPRFDPGRDVVAHALTANRPPRLDLVLASHADMDHARGLRAILETFAVGALGHSALPFGYAASGDGPGNGDALALEDLARRRGIPVRVYRAGDRLDLGHGAALEIVHPPDKGRFSSNNGSLVVRLTLHGHGLALLCGDVQIAALRRILRSGADIRADVLVLPHHGSSTSLLPEFYRAVSPRLALISCGPYNSFGFPHPAVLEELRALGIPSLDTACRGELRATWTAGPDGQPSAPHMTVFRPSNGLTSSSAKPAGLRPPRFSSLTSSPPTAVKD